VKNDKKVMWLEFPTPKVPLKDYHDGPYIAEALSYIVGQTVIDEELEFEDGYYWFQFDIK
jgi:hypothetical protein